MPSIFQFWHDGSPPLRIAARMEAWSQLNPGWRHCCFDRDSAAEFIKATFGTAPAEAFLDIRFPAMMADVFRVAITWERGGLWVDAATTCLLPLSEWLDDTAPLVLLRRPHMQPPFVWNGMIYACAPRHPFLTEVWNRISHTIQTRSGSVVWSLVGPGLFSEVLRSRSHAESVRVLAVADLGNALRIGSSSEVLPHEQHWSKRQLRESLYFSTAKCP